MATKGEAGGPEGGRWVTRATPAKATYRPGYLSNVVLQVAQQNTWICPACMLLYGALLSRVMPQTGSLAISSVSFPPATGGFSHHRGATGSAGRRPADLRAPHIVSFVSSALNAGASPVFIIGRSVAREE